MKQFTKTSLRSLLAWAFVCACASGVARAEVRDLRVISARAGGVNLVSGDVKVRRAASADWLALSSADELKGGDTVRTGSTGRVEVLLNPGSYFRAGGDTEFALVDSSLDDLRLSLARGAAVVEATGYADSELSIVVTTPHARTRIIRTGIYRVSALTGMTELTVEKGRAYVGEDEALLLKGGKVARLGSGPAEVAKYDKRTRDALDLWSRERGKELAKANDRLNRGDRHVMLATLAFDPFYSAANGGFWYRNVRAGCYTFVPFYDSWRSPYGFGYASYFPSYYGGCGGCNRSYDSGNYVGGRRPDYNNGGNNGGNYSGGTSPGRGSNPGYGSPGMGSSAPPASVSMPAPRSVDGERMVNKSREPQQ